MIVNYLVKWQIGKNDQSEEMTPVTLHIDDYTDNSATGIYNRIIDDIFEFQGVEKDSIRIKGVYKL
jgi:hypothetical protein